MDIVIHNYDSARRYIEAGELLPLLQLSDRPARRAGKELADVPFLGGPDGLASRRASASGRTPEQAAKEAHGLMELITAGRLIVAPPGLPGSLQACLRSGVADVANSAEFRKAAARAQLSIDFAGGEEALAALRKGAEQDAGFKDLVRAAVEQARK